MSIQRKLLLVLVCAAVIGAIVSGLLTSAWVSENLSGDFVDWNSGKMHLGFTAAVFSIFWALVAIPLALVGAVVIFIGLAGQRRTSVTKHR